MKKKNIYILLLIIIAISTLTALTLKNNAIDSEGLDNSTVEKNDYENESDDNLSPNKKHDFNGVKLQNNHQGVPVLCYHSIANDSSTNDPITISKDKFREHMETLHSLNYTTLTIEQLNDYIKDNIEIPENSVLITFDDGYLNNYTNAFPILKEFNMTATMFIITDYSVSKIYNADHYMLPKHVKELSDYGIDIQSHTVTHRELGKLSYEDQLSEFKNSKLALESLTGKSVTSMAYPLGSYNEDTFKAAKDAGYSMGFTIDRGYADRDDNPYEINRICVDYTYGPRDLKKVLTKIKK